MNGVSGRNLHSVSTPDHEQHVVGDWNVAFVRSLHNISPDICFRFGVVGIQARFAVERILKIPVVKVWRKQHVAEIDGHTNQRNADEWRDSFPHMDAAAFLSARRYFPVGLAILEKCSAMPLIVAS